MSCKSNERRALRVALTFFVTVLQVQATSECRESYYDFGVYPGECPSGAPEGAACTLTCIDGYEYASGNFTQTCQADGLWGPGLECKPIGGCPPIHSNYTTLPASNYDEWSHNHASYTDACDYGDDIYGIPWTYVSGDITRFCENGTWTGEPVGCRPRDGICPPIRSNYTSTQRWDFYSFNGTQFEDNCGSLEWVSGLGFWLCDEGTWTPVDGGPLVCESPKQPKGGLSGGELAIIIIAAVIFSGALIAIGGWCGSRRSSQKKSESSRSMNAISRPPHRAEHDLSHKSRANRVQPAEV